jgi:hypothetical protein
MRDKKRKKTRIDKIAKDETAVREKHGQGKGSSLERA